MKIIALYKTFSGEEFVEASIESIYEFVDKIIFLHSNINWLGEKKRNTVRPVVENWRKKNDNENKIVNVNEDSVDQEEQYNYGIDLIKIYYNYDYIMLIDTDEIWDEENFNRVIEYLKNNKDEYNAFTCYMYTFIKTIFYQIDPPEWCHPTVFISNKVEKIEGPRGMNILPKKFMENVYFYHFSYVRKSLGKVLEKIKLSTCGDQSVECTPLNIWIKEKWNRLPFAQDFHTSIKYEKSWHSIKRIFLNDLPRVLMNKDIFKFFLPQGQLLYKEMEILYKYAQEVKFVMELGTLQGLSAMILSLGAEIVHTIDIFENFNLLPDEEERDHYKGIFKLYPHKYKDVVEKLSFYSNIKIINDLTDNYVNKIDDNIIELLFMDSSHTYDLLRKDFNLWLSKVKRFGLILIHDCYSKHWPDVKKVVDEIVKEKKAINITEDTKDSTIAILRKV